MLDPDGWYAATPVAGNHLDRKAVERALLRRQARQVQRLEEHNPAWLGEEPLWLEREPRRAGPGRAGRLGGAARDVC